MSNETSNWTFSSPPSDEDAYVSSKIIPYSLSGAKRLIDLILNKVTRDHNVLPDSISQLDFNFNISNSEFSSLIPVIYENWPSVLDQNKLLTAMVVFGILVAILLPISGIIAVIKYLCCCCSKKNEEPPNKNAKWMFWAQGTTTLFLLTMGWIGVGWLNESNLAIKDGLNKLPNNLNRIFNDSDMYLNSLSKHLSYLTDENLDEAFEYLDAEFENWGKIINTTSKESFEKSKVGEIIEYSNFTLTVLDDFFKTKKNIITTHLEDISRNIQTIQEDAGKIREKTNTIASTDQCKHVFTSCNETAKQLIEILNDVDVAIDEYDVIKSTKDDINRLVDDSNLPDFKSWTFNNTENKLFELMNTNVFKHIQKYRNETRTLKTRIKDGFKPYVRSLTNLNFSSIGEYKENLVLNYVIHNIYHIILTMAFIVAFVLILACLGLIFGTFNFGECPKRSAPKLFCGATTILLLIGPFLWIVTSLIFVFGGFSDKLICQTLQGQPHAETVLYDYTNEAMNKFIQNIMNNIPQDHKTLIITVNETFKYDNLINGCKENKGLLEIFNIELNYQAYLDRYDQFNTNEIKDKLKEMVNQGINAADSSLVIDSETKDNLNEIIDKFSRFGFNQNGTEFENILNANISELLKQDDMGTLKDKFEKFKPLSNDLINDMQNIEDTINNDLIPNVHNATIFFESYRKDLLYNQTCDLRCAIDNINGLIDDARQYINITARQSLNSEVDKSVEKLTALVVEYQEHIQNHFGGCKPVYNMYHAAKISVCDNLITPVNSIWISLGMSLFFLLPALVLFKYMISYLNKDMYISVVDEDEGERYETRYQNHSQHDQQILLRNLHQNSSFRTRSLREN